ncbi:MAG TPA: Uma2 family endonuclease, partial [Tepidisphaeraceae bacterium]|nr:Uma2 family endonuclease [Tepidisphaeraceae bacterium]
YDLHAKLNVYRRHGVREYVVWRTADRAIDYFALRDGAFVPLAAGAGGVFKSVVFPGLWLDSRALIGGNPAKVLATLQKGIKSKAHAAFVAGLRKRAGRSNDR